MAERDVLEESVTIIVSCRVECRDCGWRPRQRYYEVVSDNSFWGDINEPAKSRYSLPETCKKCGSSELAIDRDKIAADVQLTGDQLSAETQRNIPSFLRRLTD